MSRIGTALSSVRRSFAGATSSPSARRAIGLCTLSVSTLACAGGGDLAAKDSTTVSATPAANVASDSARGMAVQEGAGGTLATTSPSASPSPEAAGRVPNEMGRIPVLEYHLIVPEEKGEFTRTPERLRKDLEELRRAATCR